MVNLSYTVPMQNSRAIEDLLGPLPRPRGSANRLPELHDVVGRGLPASVILRIERKLQLVRLQRDDFGNCIDCGELIAAARLDANPTATLCVLCASARES